MTGLRDEVAYSALRRLLKGEVAATTFVCEEVPFERLRRCILNSKSSPVERAVRLRHALRYADLTLTQAGSAHSMTLHDRELWPDRTELMRCGLRLRPGGSVEAAPWLPSWLVGYTEEGVDASAAKSAQRPWNNLAPTADPWITKKLAFKQYKGPGQALAVRAALNMPNDQALLVLLPTGEGKSLVFQALASIDPGHTVAVVVPTVTLAIDQAASAREAGLLPDQ